MHKPPSDSFKEANALAQKLRRKIKGEVRFDDGSRALYATDASNYRQVPIGVVVPRDQEDVIQTIGLCREFGAPITSRGGGTSLAGQCCNVAVVMDTSKYFNRILEIDPVNKIARVEPGLVLDDLRKQTGNHGLTFGPDPATHSHCTLGGMMGNNSCGIHSVMAQFLGNGSRTSDNIKELEILTYDGVRLRVGPTTESDLAKILNAGGRKAEIYTRLNALRERYGKLIRNRFPQIPRRVSGYNLDELLPENGFNVARALIGSEGTCVSILEATLHLIHNPPERVLVILGYPDVFEAADHVPKIMELRPVGLEGMDHNLIRFNEIRTMNRRAVKIIPPGHGWLLVEFGGDSRPQAEQQAKAMMEALKKGGSPPSMKLFDDPDEEELVWELRESGLGATAFVPGMADSWPGWEDSAVAPERVGDYMRDLRSLFDKYGYNPAVYGHFGQGCVHCRIQFDVKTQTGLQKYKSFLEEAAELVVSYGGSLSGEHGDGQSRAELLPRMYGPEIMEAFREFKSIWDPDWKMNPGKVIEANPILSHLRLGPDYNPPQLETHFQFPDDHHSFGRAALRCVGVGKCRRHENGTMCPSYLVTREEEHSTRGRARLLWEMLNGDVISKSGWRSEAVRESLELCLACKGCKADCPVNVDMATYKAEFLSHYYEHRLRPRAAYAMGLIYWWARLASHFPRMANYFTQQKPFSTMMKWIGGIAPEREMPKFAVETFREWFHKRGEHDLIGRKVILWPDTFNNFFFPDTLKAAVSVLEATGCQVTIPKPLLCCGRPLYDFGMLDKAEHLLQEILEKLRNDIRHDVPIIGLEPSCVSVFRDELCNLFSNDEDAKRLRRNVFTLGEFIEKEAPHFRFPKLSRKAVVHAHCHHKAIMGVNCEQKILERIGLDFQVLDSGCCGMAGSFGFERGEKYDVSIKCGERVLLPAVREADENTIIITDGFSCREQISQQANRHPMHLAEILAMALREGQVQTTGAESQGRKQKRTIPEAVGDTIGATMGVFSGITSFFSRRKSRH